MIRREREPEHGQIIILFALALTALLAMGALLFSGANTLVLRRQLQNAGDAAALAAANIMQNNSTTCTSTRIAAAGTGGTNDLYLAAKASVQSNLGWSDAKITSQMAISCPTDSAYINMAV